MTEKLGRAWVLAIATCLVLAFGVAACGGSGGGGETGSAEATTSEEAAPTEPEGASSPSELLTGIEPPSGAKLLDEKTSGDVIYQHYSTSKTPKQVEELYGEEVQAAGWSIVQSGGSGGSWGPYGGSDYGLTAKRDDDYFDLEAGGEKSSTSYFEICASVAEGTREDCDELSNESSSNSGGSESGGDDESSESGGS
jgi:hypothetical protein